MLGACVRDRGRHLRAAARARAGEHVVQRSIEKIVHEPTLAKTHFALGRMHVDVDAPRIEFEEQHECRMAAVEEYVRIGLAHRVRDEPIAHRAPVDVEILLIGLSARCGRQTHPPMQAQTRGRMLDDESLRDEILTEHVGDTTRALAVVARWLQHTHRLAVVAEPELDRRMRKRERLDELVDVIELGALGAQELASRWHVVEKIAHVDLRAARVLRWRWRARLAAIDFDAPRGVGIGEARGQSEARYRSDRRQRFAAKSERAYAFEIFERRDLARRMRGNRERKIVRNLDACRRRRARGISRAPPASMSMSMRVAPASRLFSTSSLTTEAGRSMTSPAAIWLTSWAEES